MGQGYWGYPQQGYPPQMPPGYNMQSQQQYGAVQPGYGPTPQGGYGSYGSVMDNVITPVSHNYISYKIFRFFKFYILFNTACVSYISCLVSMYCSFNFVESVYMYCVLRMYPGGQQSQQQSWLGGTTGGGSGSGWTAQ